MARLATATMFAAAPGFQVVGLVMRDDVPASPRPIGHFDAADASFSHSVAPPLVARSAAGASMRIASRGLPTLTPSSPKPATMRSDPVGGFRAVEAAIPFANEDDQVDELATEPVTPAHDAMIGGPVPVASPKPPSVGIAERLAGLPASVRKVAVLAALAGILFYFARGSSLEGVQAAIRERALVDVHDDFRSGVSAWQGDEGWSTSWKYEQKSGFLVPGKLALHQSTTGLRNYRAEFMGMIEKKGLGFAFRAADTKNYYAAKLLISKPGPRPSLAIVRWAVIDGKETPRTELPVPLSIRADTVYRVLVTVRDDAFTISINGQLVDTWSDSRLAQGGIGFFLEKGELAGLRWVRVIDKDDFLGTLCSYLSPGTDDRKGSRPSGNTSGDIR
ncbi:MAG: hypothetical protein ACRD96_26360 [Bryobacteraceae bacterium]